MQNSFSVRESKMLYEKSERILISPLDSWKAGCVRGITASVILCPQKSHWKTFMCNTHTVPVNVRVWPAEDLKSGVSHNGVWDV